MSQACTSNRRVCLWQGSARPVLPALTRARAQMLASIVYTLRDKTVDAVLLLDRLDSYRVDASDVQARRSQGARAG